MKFTPAKRREESSATLPQTLALIAAFSGLFALTAFAANPGWWSGVLNGNSARDYTVANQGQLKYFTEKAVGNLNTTIAGSGGAGPALSNLVYGWQQDYVNHGYNASNLKPGDYQAVNVGQLKYVANLVYGQLRSAGYTGLYPSWLASSNAADLNAANLGQLKEVFNFDLSVAPATVTGLTVSSSNPGEIDLSWTLPTMNNATSITVLQSTNGTTWTAVATLAANATNYADPNLDSTQTYTYEVSASNSVDSSPTPPSSSEAPLPPPRYAVIDLGTNMSPMILSNGGYVLMSSTSTSGNYYRWGNGVTELLSAGGIGLGLDMFYGTGYFSGGIDDQGNVVATIVLAQGTYISGFLFQQSYVWPSFSTTPLPLPYQALGPAPAANPITATRVNTIDYNGKIYAEQFEASPLLWDYGYLPPGQFYDIDNGVYWTSYTADESSLVPLTLVQSSDPTFPQIYYQTSTNEQILKSKNNHTIGYDTFQATYNSTNTVDGFPVAFYPEDISTAGIAIGVDPSTPTCFLYQNGMKETIPGASYLGALNHALRNKHNSDGSVITPPVECPQVIGNTTNGYNDTLFQENPDTGNYESPLISQLVSTNSGWSGITGNAINDSGAIVGTATYSGTNTAIAAGSHGVMLTPVSPSTDTIYMFSGHDSDQVNLTTANFPGWTYQWKLKDSASGTAQGSFENYGTTTWSSTGTTATVTFRPGVSGTGNIAGDTRAQSPGKNTIQLWANGTLIWEKPLEVLQILPRSTWGAAAANTSTLAGMSGINQFTVHHSSKEAFGTAEILRIQKEHMGLLNGTTIYYTVHPHDVWGDIGYHFILDPSNDSDPDTVLLYEGRQLEGLGLSGGSYTVPAAVKLKNTLSGIDICMLGNYQTGTWASWMLGNETFSETRRKKLEMVLTAFSFRYQTPATLTATYPPPPVTSPPISYHQQLAAQAPVSETTECPGNTVISTIPTTQTKVQNDLK